MIEDSTVCTPENPDGAKPRKGVRQFDLPPIPDTDMNRIIGSSKRETDHPSPNSWFLRIITTDHPLKRINGIIETCLSAPLNGFAEAYGKAGRRSAAYVALPEAPACVFVVRDRTTDPIPSGTGLLRNRSGGSDASDGDIEDSPKLAIERMTDTASNMGYGACLRAVPTAGQADVLNLLSLDPDHHEIIMAFSLGKPEGELRPTIDNPFEVPGLDDPSEARLDFEAIEAFVREAAGEKIVQHAIRAVYYSLFLQSVLGGDPFVILLGTLLHDSGWRIAFNGGRLEDHARIGADLIERTFQRNLDPDLLAKVVFCAKYHSIALKPANPTLEQKIVSDGEKLEFLLTQKPVQDGVKRLYEHIHFDITKEILGNHFPLADIGFSHKRH